jgi:cytochrome P450
VTGTASPRLPWPAGQPWPAYAALHEHGAPVWFDDDLGTWIVIGHAEATEVLRGSGWSSDPSSASTFGELSWGAGIDPSAISQFFIFTDPPLHVRLRGAVQPPFGPAAVEALRHRVRAIAAAAIEGLDPDEEVDLMARVARPVPLAVVGELLDLPHELVGALADESPALVRILDVEATTGDLAAAAGAFTGLLLELLPLVSARRLRPGADVLSWIAADETLALEEVVFAVLLLAIAGHETTANLVGTVLAQGPVPPTPDRAWAVEVTRLHAPVQAVSRVATVGHRIGDQEIAPGDQVVVAIAAANRDPAVFDDPGAFVAGRTVEPLSFGLGRHHCLGARLAILELEEIVGAVARHGGLRIGAVEWNGSRTICGPTTLRARFAADGDLDAPRGLRTG